MVRKSDLKLRRHFSNDKIQGGTVPLVRDVAGRLFGPDDVTINEACRVQLFEPRLDTSMFVNAL